MERIAFQLQLKADKTDEYDEAHRHVWPELLAELEAFGVSEYSIFRHGEQLFLYMHVANYEELAIRLAASDVNRRWQEEMAHLFEPAPGLRSDETYAMMNEVFFMKGRSQAVEDK